MTTNQERQWRFAGIADGYDRYMAPMLSTWTPDLFDQTNIGSGDDVLDVACGTGIVARHAADKVTPDGSVSGIDVDLAMVEVARAKGRTLPVPFTCYQADATDLPFDDESFDVVFCQQGLQFISQRQAAVDQLYRVLKPGRTMALSVWGPLQHTPGYQVLGEAMAMHIGEEPATANAVPFALHDHDELAGLVDSAGFGDVDVKPVTREVRFPSAREFFRREVVSWLAGAVGQPDEAQREAVIAELERGLEPHIDSDGLAFPMEALIVSGRKP